MAGRSGALSGRPTLPARGVQRGPSSCNEPTPDPNIRSQDPIAPWVEIVHHLVEYEDDVRIQKLVCTGHQTNTQNLKPSLCQDIQLLQLIPSQKTIWIADRIENPEVGSDINERAPFTLSSLERTYKSNHSAPQRSRKSESGVWVYAAGRVVRNGERDCCFVMIRNLGRTRNSAKGWERFERGNTLETEEAWRPQGSEVGETPEYIWYQAARYRRKLKLIEAVVADEEQV
ncbi:hypothetical protein F5141DRAFT_1067263 [Pisolithus sp. B1]|nr:hypothetical protein F5141DRAFT_1067263 [Pisolithus sp. B1]